MNCSPTIAIALLLLSLTAGMWLLYKTQKENLNILFKIVAWLVIVVSLGSMICCGLRCVFLCCKEKCSKMECSAASGCGQGMSQCGMERGNCMMRKHGGMSEQIVICTDDKEECGMKKGECCKEGGEEACDEKCKGNEGGSCCKKGGEKCDMKKDTLSKS